MELKYNRILHENFFHIVLCCDDNYIKYCSVLLSNIVMNIDKTKKSEISGLHFHIICDYVSEVNEVRLKLLKKELCKIYSIEISLHYFDKNLVQAYELPDWIKSYSTYYRIFSSRYLPVDIQKYLYIDVDVIVDCDIRDFFEIELQDKVLAAMVDINTETSSVMGSVYRKAKIKGVPDFKFTFPKLNFNAGILLINAEVWKKMNIETRCIQFLNNYETLVCDQDALCAVIGDNFIPLSLEWNFYIGNMFRDNQNKNTFLNESDEPMWYFTRDEYLKMKNNIKIAHFTSHCQKSWEYLPEYSKDLFFEQYYYFKWWEYALKTPIFKYEFEYIRKNMLLSKGAVEKVKTHLSYKLGKEILSIKENKLKILILPFTLIFIYIKHKISNLIFKLILNSNPNLKSSPLNHYSDYQEALKIQNYLSYKLGNLLIKHPFTFVFRVAGVYKEWKKGR
ncbi:hypothetical protein FTK47_06915 [Campylobacter jejuni]|nr:hypothetical protein [Campylobacter jejuni]